MWQVKTNKCNTGDRMNWNEIEITAPKLYLKPFTSLDADETFKCITTTLTKYMSWDPPQSRDDFDQTWRKWLPAIQNGTDLVFVIRSVINDEFLGLAGLHQTQSKTPELGIWIREDRHCLGFGLEAVKSVAAWASSHFHYEHFIYPVAIDNQPSRKIAESLGGTIQSHQKQRKYDSVTYAIPILNNIS